MQLDYRNIKQEVERATVVGEVRAGAVNEAYVKLLWLLYIYIVLGQYGYVLCIVRIICNL